MFSLKRTERNSDGGEEGEGAWPFSWLLRHEVGAFPSKPAEVETVVDEDETEES